MLQTNQVLRQRYQIHSLLGQGGFGAVYKAIDLNLNRGCAVKESFFDATLTPAQQQDQQQQFQRAIAFLARFTHSYIPRLLDAFIEPNGNAYVVMDLVEGKSLQDFVSVSGIPLDERIAILWVKQVLRALDYLHHRIPPVVHLEVVPYNMLVTQQGHCVLTNFSLARELTPGRTAVDRGGVRSIVPGYSPPEQYGAFVDQRSDIYSIGATLYYILTGIVPLKSIERLTGKQMTLPRAITDRISLQTERVILRAMAIARNDRFQSAQEMIDALQD